MKPLEHYVRRRTERAQLAKAALQVCSGKQLELATECINRTAFSARDVIFWHPILALAEHDQEEQE